MGLGGLGWFFGLARQACSVGGFGLRVTGLKKFVG